MPHKPQMVYVSMWNLSARPLHDSRQAWKLRKIQTGVRCLPKKDQSFACLCLLQFPQFQSGSGARFDRADFWVRSRSFSVKPGKYQNWFQQLSCADEVGKAFMTIQKNCPLVCQFVMEVGRVRDVHVALQPLQPLSLGAKDSRTTSLAHTCAGTFKEQPSSLIVLTVNVK